MANKKEVDQLHRNIIALQRKIALSDSQEERNLYLDQIQEYQAQIRKLRRKAPNVVAIKDAPTVGEKIERRLNNKVGKSSFGRTRVML